MRKIKKIVAVVLATLMLMSVAVFSASAAPTAPEFKVSLVSETDKTVVVRISFEKGAFNSLGLTVYTSSAIKECTAFTQSDDFKNLALDQIMNDGDQVTSIANPATKKAAIMTLQGIKAPVGLYDVTFTKKTSAPVKNTDINLVIDDCVITLDNNSQGDPNVDITDLAKVTVSFKNFTLNETSVAMNYKASHTISITSNYAADELTWTSSNEKVATVDENGNVYASGTGSATITVTSADGLVNESCEVSVSYQWWEWIIIIVLFGWLWY